MSLDTGPLARKPLKLVAALFVLAILGAACGGSSADDATAAGGTDVAPPETSSSDAPTAPPATTPPILETGSETADTAGTAETAETADTSAADTESETAASIPVGGSSLADSDFYGDYQIIDGAFGTMVTVAITNDSRIMQTNALPPFEAGEFPEGNNTELTEQDIEYILPLVPTFTGDETAARSIGVSIGGIKFDAGTAQVARCENGVQYRVEAVQELIPFGIDANNAHVQNDGTYHYHNVPITELDGEEPEFIGFAFDGHLIFYSPSNQYESSYQLRTEDREGIGCTYSEPDFAEITFDSTPDGTFGEDYAFVDGSGDLDRCNGIEIDGQYVYFLTDEYPLIPRCLNGEVTISQAGAGGGGVGGGGGPGGPPPEREGAPAEGEGAPSADAPVEREDAPPEGEAPVGEAPPEGEGAPPEGGGPPPGEGAPPEGGGPPPGDGGPPPEGGGPPPEDE